ncbi:MULTISPECIES: antA/AntB antirepressor family protein [Halomonas]|uniref:antA/AntB antirepressor family protein n=1 Tax=Halomonas TaxID=2745 RepID=UPI001C959E2C|nr:MULTISPECIES: antA/AntB antirepressor family protein [Halomonas]MBY6208786.1 antA/AntB antirepressor family protein [Halomonas sp. DP3Y7-2]MBY6227256.1 antA/AntB antirepressor family protein [Halomonas sp. DP3Y7-1]MCA0914994.1 antA/AntB antirepressor family protein [Halomonas denitrificans]
MRDSSSNAAIIAIGTASIGGQAIETVNARELHAFLGVGRDFTSWIKSRIAQYGFAEGGDFVVLVAAPQNGGAGNRGVRTEYHLSLDMAKELSMVERNEKGKQARRYFIECERRAKDVTPLLPQTMAEALRLAADQAERLEQQERALQAAAPKVAFAKQVEISHDAITVGQAAKTIGTGRNRLFSFLRHHGWVNRRNEPYQAKIEMGLMDVKVGHWEHPEKGLQENITALVTGKGLIKLQKLWDEQKEVAA